MIRDGQQVEAPDFWLDKGHPWEIERLDLNFEVHFYGKVRKVFEHNKEHSIWEGYETIMARAYDNPVPGYDTFNTINLRLFRSTPATEFDFSFFN